MPSRDEFIRGSLGMNLLGDHWGITGGMPLLEVHCVDEFVAGSLGV